jgi:hypothetical protein
MLNIALPHELSGRDIQQATDKLVHVSVGLVHFSVTLFDLRLHVRVRIALGSRRGGRLTTELEGSEEDPAIPKQGA